MTRSNTARGAGHSGRLTASALASVSLLPALGFGASSTAALASAPVPVRAAAMGNEAVSAPILHAHVRPDLASGSTSAVFEIPAMHRAAGSTLQILALAQGQWRGAPTWQVALRGSRVLDRIAVPLEGEANWDLSNLAFGRVEALGAVLVQHGSIVGAAVLPLSSISPIRPIDPSVAPPAVDALIVTEFMKDPAAVTDSKGEWLEVHNLSAVPVDLEGWTLRDLGSNATVLTAGGAGIVVAPGAFAVLGRSADPSENGGVAMAATYSGFTLGNGADQIILEAPGGHEVTRIEYGDGPEWPDEAGRSVELMRRFYGTSSADLPQAWQPGDVPMPGGDLGTPGSGS